MEVRQRMERRRLEEAFLQYALLNVSSWYPSEVVRDDLHLHQGLSESLLRITPLFHDAFIAKHSGNVIQDFPENYLHLFALASGYYVIHY